MAGRAEPSRERVHFFSIILILYLYFDKSVEGGKDNTNQYLHGVLLTNLNDVPIPAFFKVFSVLPVSNEKKTDTINVQR